MKKILFLTMTALLTSCTSNQQQTVKLSNEIDSLKAEIFLPDQDERPILSRRILPNGKYAWNMEDDDTYNIRFTENQWVIEKRGRILYSTKR